MQRFILNTLLALSMTGTILIASACDEDGAAVSVNVTHENLCGEIAEVTCHNAFQCCTGLELEAIYGIEITNTEAECRRDMKLTCENTHSELIYAMEQGTAALAVEDLEACLSALVAPSGECFPYQSQTDLSEMCSMDMIIGKQESGDSCLLDLECEEDTYCGPDRNCTSLPTKGDPCPGGVCASGLYCAFDLIERTYTCVDLAGSGDPCVMSTNCEEGLYCSTGGTCASLVEIGETCDASDNCESGFCLPGVCEEDGTECFSPLECGDPGTCSVSFQPCYQDRDCLFQVCSNSGNYCTTAADCGLCAVTGSACNDTSQCNNLIPKDVCEFGTCDPETCEGAVPGNCIGTPVCADNWMTLDYCELNPLSIL